MGDLKPFHAAGLIFSIPDLHKQFRPIPPGFWEPHGEDKKRVQCVCGNRPVLRKGELRECREDAASPHKCSRFFMACESSVLVANSPKR